MNTSFKLKKGKLITIGRLKILIGITPRKKEVVTEGKCICETSEIGWYREHHTDWY